MRGQVITLVACQIFGWGLAATGTESAELPLVMPELQTVFDESFASHPNDRFEFLGPVSLESSPGCLTLQSGDGRNMSAVHWAITGPVGRCEADPTVGLAAG